MKERFARFAQGVANSAGSHWAFSGALGIVLLWLLTGPIFGFTDTWQLLINTFTTLVTFVMVFVIQNASNRDTAAIMIKLNELIAVDRKARNSLINAENFSDDELDRMIADLQKHAAERVPASPPDTPG